MHPVTARAIAAEQIRDWQAKAAAMRLAREAERPRRPWLGVRLARAGRAPQPAAAPCPAHGPAV